MIRRAHASDVLQVATLYHVVWHETQARFMPTAECTHRSIEFFVDRMTALLPTTLVEERDGKIVAFSAWKGALLSQIFVAVPHRGSSIASSLMTASEVEMAKEGTSEAELHCAVGNERARTFYERMGWLHRGKIMEQVAGDGGQVDVPFWRMTKVLATQ
jgi:ribosomal protein S18 acetylase RimI-like enzyme